MVLFELLQTPHALATSSTPPVVIDALLGVPYVKGYVKSFFGLQDLAHDNDFVPVLEVCPSYL